LIWKWLYYNTSSSNDHGTLYQLKNLINRRNVKTHPKDDFRACDDFFVLVVHLAAAIEILDIESLNEIPKGAECDWMLPNEERKMKLDGLCNKLIDHFVKVGLIEDNNADTDDTDDTDSDEMESEDECEANDDHDSESDTDSKNESEQKSVCIDGVLEYAKDVISLGLLYLECRDAVAEGAGFRVEWCWKFWLPLFKASDKKIIPLKPYKQFTTMNSFYRTCTHNNGYTADSSTLKGWPGCNIPADEHQEHLNRVCKDSISHLGANKTKESIIRVGKCVGMISKVTENFDKQICVAYTPGKHTVSSSKKDMDVIVNELVERQILSSEKGRKHSECTKRSVFDKVSKLQIRD
jgi:L1 cell adhesion molecule like protein